jgi:hypothetical protein
MILPEKALLLVPKCWSRRPARVQNCIVTKKRVTERLVREQPEEQQKNPP